MVTHSQNVAFQERHNFEEEKKVHSTRFLLFDIVDFSSKQKNISVENHNEERKPFM